MPFGGDTYDRERDKTRLFRQLGDVKRAVIDGKWHTLPELSALTGHPEASVSARLRDLRKDKFGGYTVVREYVSDGLWRYRMIVPRPVQDQFGFIAQGE
jgi:hypothetical protein